MILCSVQHTGTKFLRDMFGEIHHASFVEDIEPGTRYLRVGHISGGLISGILYRLKSDQAIVPLRHPRSVTESWRRRDKSIAELNYNFNLLFNEIDKFNPFYLAIDSNNRDRQLTQINKDLGLDLKTDWKPRNSVMETHSINWKDLPETNLEKHEFWNRFYG